MSQRVFEQAPGGKEQQNQSSASSIGRNRIALLTAGRDRPYALGLAAALSANDVCFDLIGGDMLDSPELHVDPRIRFLNLRDQREGAGFTTKVLRILAYYSRLIRYAMTAETKVFHILWNNKFELFDRTLLMLYYKLLRKQIVLTVHNVNAGKRDGTDSFLNRLSLRIQYRLSHHIFVHTRRMKNELTDEFSVPNLKISVIPFGINNTVPNTGLSAMEAKRWIGVPETDKTLLFFGNIARYKGLEYLVDAFSQLAKKDPRLRLIIAGRTKGDEDYWRGIEKTIAGRGLGERVITRIEFIPDNQAELYFKAADVLVLPYAHVFQSGVLFLGYSFGLPVIAADVGTLSEDVADGRTGFVFKSKDSLDLARVIEKYFESDLFREIATHRTKITRYANERYSWTKVAAITMQVYQGLPSS